MTQRVVLSLPPCPTYPSPCLGGINLPWGKSPIDRETLTSFSGFPPSGFFPRPLPATLFETAAPFPSLLIPDSAFLSLLIPDSAFLSFHSPPPLERAVSFPHLICIRSVSLADLCLGLSGCERRRGRSFPLFHVSPLYPCPHNPLSQRYAERLSVLHILP